MTRKQAEAEQQNRAFSGSIGKLKRQSAACGKLNCNDDDGERFHARALFYCHFYPFVGRILAAVQGWSKASPNEPAIRQEHRRQFRAEVHRAGS